MILYEIKRIVKTRYGKFAETGGSKEASCPGEEFTPPPNNEDLILVEEKVDSVKFTAVKPSLV